MSETEAQRETDIAIVGMSARLPGARTWREYWANLRGGVESIRTLTDEELERAGVRAATLRSGNYVRRSAQLDDIDQFDPDFFGLSPKEAGIMDPQHRHFLECCWEALEDAAHPPAAFDGAIGVFGGCGMGSYMMLNILTNPALVESVGMFLLRHTGNDKDFLSTRVSYCLDLKGPSINVQTACSTSLVAVHTACQSLLNMECDMALAGGATIELPKGHGYHFEEGEVLSPDGHCRAFDADSKGTVFGSGAGVVVLRRLEDALEDDDEIYAVIRGSAVNNDGSGKVGYLAPSVDGQAAAIAEALAVSGVDADEVDYVECHGTGTPVGDPIEITALTQAFRETTERSGFCGVGSVKTNIGHLDTAAGVASLMKVALALRHGEIPPTLNYTSPNPNIDFERTPFYVNGERKPWPAAARPRVATVNSLGVGGTNAHVVLEEAPVRKPSSASRHKRQLLCLSAKSTVSLDGASNRLAQFLRANPEVALADVAHTLRKGRAPFERRRVVVATTLEEAAARLESRDVERVFTQVARRDLEGVVFLLPGGGAQNPAMMRGLYESEPIFRASVDRGLAMLDAQSALPGALDFDLRRLLLTDDQPIDAVKQELERPAVQLPAIFIVEHALAELWMSRGIEPSALIGHSMGENTAACLAGVMRYEDALGLVALRGQLFETIDPGGMISIGLGADSVEPLLSGSLSIAVINAPDLCVVSGPSREIDDFARLLAEKEIESTRVPIEIAAHSSMLDPILEAFGDYLRRIVLSRPQVRFTSNLTGTWITEEQATSPDYWVAHLRGTVRFADCVGTIAAEGRNVLLEVGPGRALSSLCKIHPDVDANDCVLSSLPHPDQDVDDAEHLLTMFGRLWAAGLDPDIDQFSRDERRLRISLPTYHFNHQSYWIEPGDDRGAIDSTEALERAESLEDFFWCTSWTPTSPRPPATRASDHEWLVFLDDAGVGDALAGRIEADGGNVIRVRAGDTYSKQSPSVYTLSPEHGREGYAQLIEDLAAGERLPTRIMHGWSLTAKESFRPGSSLFHRNQECGFLSLLHLASALSAVEVDEEIHFVVLANGLFRVADEELRYPEKSTLLGPCGVIPRELSQTTVSCVDVELPSERSAPARWLRGAPDVKEVADQLWTELVAEPANEILALRGGRRLVQAVERITLASAGATETAAKRLREGGTYLITGGLGDIGLVLAKYLAREYRANVVLLSRTPLPDEDEWETWLHRNGPEEPTSAKILSIREIQACGGHVLVADADVTNAVRMREVVGNAREAFGVIHGVFHAAGMVDDGLIQTKSEFDTEQVMGAKVQGTLVLDELFREEPLEILVLFSSTSVAIRPAGQVDYVAANAFLNAFAEAAQGRSSTTTIAVGWGVWKDVGMAARQMPVHDSPVISTESLTAHPLFERRIGHANGRRLVTGTWRVNEKWILDEHRTLNGNAILPGSSYFELARAALAAHDVTGPFEIRDLFFFQPLQVDDGAATSIRVRLMPEQGGYALDVQSEVTDDEGVAGWATHGQCKVELRGFAVARDLELDPIRERCSDTEAPEQDGFIRTGQERHLRFGPRWRVLRSASFGENEAIASLELDERFVEDLDGYRLHPALFDLATGFQMMLIDGYSAGSLWVPVSYGRVRIHHPLDRQVHAWARGRGVLTEADGVASFDVTIADSNGRVLVEVEDFSIRKLSSTAGFGDTGARPAARLDRDQGSSDARSHSPAERRFHETVELGLTSAESMAALERILLQENRAQVYASSLDLAALERSAADAPADAPDDATRFARPDLESEYVEPKDDVERTLVAIWEQLLGVDQVGTKDSFFDLGGHSLIAVRLFAKIKREYQVDLPISVLFEAPTVETCAEMIRERCGIEESVEGSSSNGAAGVRYKHLVAMHPGEPPTEATPFFLVAGMFGNVLNLRHLAHMIGADRALYGLQARGLYGGESPHETFEAMASAYIEELRQVQPHGPYLLGGFSGGGITAYEIAQQLRRAGENVQLVAMLDTPLPFDPPLTRRERVAMHTNAIRRRGPAYIVDWARSRMRWELQRLQERFASAADSPSAATFHNEEIEAAFRRACDRYDVQAYDGDIALYRPKLEVAHVVAPGRVLNSDKRLVFDDNGWTPYARRVEIQEVPGDHDSMVLEPNVRVLAALLRARLLESDRGRLIGAEASEPTVDV